MKRIVSMMIVAFAVTFGIGAGEMAHAPAQGKKMPKNYRMVPMKDAQILQDGPAKMFCVKCGMTLPMFYRTNHAAKVDGKMEQFCSIHCLAEEMASGKKVEDIRVVDNVTLKFIPVEKAWYVVGSSKPGTMSKVSKYAFGDEKAARAFAKENGGKVMTYGETMAIVKKNLEKESAMIAKKQAMMAKKGEEIYKKLCKPIEEKFSSAAEAKAYIRSSGACGDLKGKQLQAVGLYLKSR